MSFESFRRYLASSHRSPTTGKPLSHAAASDYPSRLRRLEIILQTSLEGAPPELLRSIAGSLRNDPRVAETVPIKVIGDIGVALRAYAGYLATDDQAEGEDANLHLLTFAELVTAFTDGGFKVEPTTSSAILEARQDDLSLYLNRNGSRLVIVHPALEQQYSLLADAAGLAANRRLSFLHHHALKRFPQRNSNQGLSHYGIQFAFIAIERVQHFILALRSALLSANAMEPEKALGEEIREPETEATVMAKARKGQGRFRADLLDYWQGRCALTDVSAPELLRASHIKSWRDSNGSERLDMFNGLLLAVHLDALFDRTLITFENSGDMLVSNRLSANDRGVFGLSACPRKLLLSASHLGYLHHHRTRFLAAEQN